MRRRLAKTALAIAVGPVLALVVWAAVRQRAPRPRPDRREILAQEHAGPSPLGPRATEGIPALLKAAAQGDTAAIRRLLSGGALVNERDKDGWTALHWASDAGQLEAVRLLLREGADAKAAAYDVDRFPTDVLSPGLSERRYKRSTRTPLHAALVRGHLTVAQALIDHGVEVNGRGVWGMTPLHFAANCAPPEAVELLLERGADINTRDDHGWTALHWAVQDSNAESAGILLKRGADPNCRSSKSFVMWGVTHWSRREYPDGVTPLHVATRGLEMRGMPGRRYDVTPEQIATVHVLLAEGADPSVKDDSGATPRDYAKRFWSSSALADLLEGHP